MGGLKMAKSRTFKAFKWTAVAMVGKALFAFIQLFALARILAPEQFGVIAITMTVLNMARILSDLGASSALIHFSDSTKEEENALYWFNVATGGLLTIALMLASGPISKFYSDASLKPLIIIGSFHFIIWSFGQQFRVLSERNLTFNRLAIIEVTSFALGTLIAIILALMGAGPASVVWGFISIATINSLSSIIFLAGGRIPVPNFGLKKIRRFVMFGIRVLGLSMVNTTALQSDVFISGRLLSLERLGEYYQPRELCLRIMFVVNPIITRVTFPLMASQKNNLAKIKETYLNSILLTNSINFPIYGAIFIMSREFTFVALGSQWLPSAHLLALLALWSGIRSVGNPISSLLLALGETNLALKSATSVLIGLIISVFIGAQWKFEGVVIAMTIFYVFLIPAFWFFLVRPTVAAGFIEYHTVVLRPFITTALTCALTCYALRIIEIDLIERLIAGAAMGLVLYTGLSFFINRRFLKLVCQHAFGK